LTNRNYRNLAKLCPFITINGHYIQPIIALICHEDESLVLDKFENTFSIVSNLKHNIEEVDSIFWLPISYFKECLCNRPNQIFDFVKVPFESSQAIEMDYFNRIFEHIPEFYTQIFFNVKGLHLVYGFNSFFVMLAVFLNEEADTSLLEIQIDLVNRVNCRNILQFIQNMNKGSYMLFVRNKNKEYIDKEKKSKL